MIELLPPMQHRAPLDAAEILAAHILHEQTGEVSDGSNYVYAWYVLDRFDDRQGIPKSRSQVVRLMVKASELAREEVAVGAWVAHVLMNRSFDINSVKMKRPAFFADIPAEIVQYVESYYEPL